MDWIAQQINKPLLYIIDREADSAAHFRHWSVSGHHFLVRVNARNTLSYQGVSQQCQQIAEQLSYSQPLKTVLYKGQKAFLSLAKIDVVLTGYAKPQVCEEGKRKAPQKGEALPLTLVCTQITNAKGDILAQWFLLSNRPYSAEKLASFYYWRWQIPMLLWWGLLIVYAFAIGAPTI